MTRTHIHALMNPQTHQGLGLDYSSLPLCVDTRHKCPTANANANPDANQCVRNCICVRVCVLGRRRVTATMHTQVACVWLVSKQVDWHTYIQPAAMHAQSYTHRHTHSLTLWHMYALLHKPSHKHTSTHIPLWLYIQELIVSLVLFVLPLCAFSLHSPV